MGCYFQHIANRPKVCLSSVRLCRENLTFPHFPVRNNQELPVKLPGPQTHGYDILPFNHASACSFYLDRSILNSHQSRPMTVVGPLP